MDKNADLLCPVEFIIAKQKPKEGRIRVKYEPVVGSHNLSSAEFSQTLYPD